MSIIFTYALIYPEGYVTEPILTILLTIIGIDAIIVVCRKWCSYTSCAVYTSCHLPYVSLTLYTDPIPLRSAYSWIWESNTWP